MTDTLPNRPSGEVIIRDDPKRIPWTAICCALAAIATLAAFIRPCVPVDVGWRFAEKTAVETAATQANADNTAAHAVLKNEVTAINTEMKAVKISVEAVNATIRDEILTRLPETKRKRGRP